MIKQFTLTPPGRLNDSHPFVTLKIREAATAAGSYTLIDTQSWTDTTPSTPVPTAVETTLATLEDGWYEFQWTDDIGAVTQWWGPISGAGDVLFTVEEARDALNDPAYDEAKILDARTYCEAELESALRYSLVPRTVSETLSGRDGVLSLRPYARNITAVTVDGSALSAGQLASLAVDSGYVYGYAWPTGWGNIVVAYTHGLEVVPPGAKRAALALAVDYLGAGASGAIDPRATRVVTVDGEISLRSGGDRFTAAGVSEWIAANRLPLIA